MARQLWVDEDMVCTDKDDPSEDRTAHTFSHQVRRLCSVFIFVRTAVRNEYPKLNATLKFKPSVLVSLGWRMSG